MFVEMWDVGMADSTWLPMTTAHISSHLLADWIPSFPASVSSSFMGWPQFLMDVKPHKGNLALGLKGEMGRSERQWKSVVSWMLGAAGARHFLATDGYRWIAPLSAFYPQAAKDVDLSGWNPDFPPTVLSADRQPGSASRLRPDYIALRPTAPGEPYRWAVVEAKGTQRSLRALNSCPTDWYQQVRNVALLVAGSPTPVSRHLVVATRVNPNGVRPSTRRLQIRAWNAVRDSEPEGLPPAAAVEVASAHLFGLFRSLDLFENARALAIGVQARDRTRRGVGGTNNPRDAFDRAAAELHDRGRSLTAGADPGSDASIELLQGAFEMVLAQPLVAFSRSLMLAADANAAVVALAECDAQLNQWHAAPHNKDTSTSTVRLPTGVTLRERRRER